jgi:hypothetical protein
LAKQPFADATELKTLITSIEDLYTKLAVSQNKEMSTVLMLLRNVKKDVNTPHEGDENVKKKKKKYLTIFEFNDVYYIDCSQFFFFFR